MSNVKLGIAPIGWTNDDMPDLGREISFDRCISEMSEAGYKGTEVGNKYPKDPVVLKKELKKKGLQVANCWYSSFILTKPMAEVEADFRAKCEYLEALGAKRIGVSEQSYSIQGTTLSIFDKKYYLNDKEWKILAEGLNHLGEVALEYGINMTYHHHMGTVIQDEAEIDKFIELTDPKFVSLLYDTGHLAYCGIDYLKIIKKYIGRIKHIHLKDIRPEVIAKVKANKLSFLDGVRMGTYSVPGDGVIDFAPIFEVIAQSGYKGWLLVEAEQDPAKAIPLDYAKSAKSYIDNLIKRYNI